MDFKRILVAINVRWWNAEAAYGLNLARGLVQSGRQVWVVVNPGSPPHKKALELNLNVITNVLLDELSPLTQWKAYQTLSKLVRQHGIEVIHTFKSNGAHLFSRLSKKFPGLLYIRTRGQARPPKSGLLGRLAYGPGACDGIIAVGEQVLEWIKVLDIKNQNMTVIHYGDNPFPPKSPDNGETVRQELGLLENDRLILLVGRFQEIKGHLVLLAALADMGKKRPHTLFLVKDPDEFPDELQKARDFMQVHNLDSKVSILGFKKNLADFIQAADLGVIPSLGSEVNCRVAVEFFSLGLPVLSFPAGTLPDIIRHKENGYLCENFSSKTLKQGLTFCLANKIDLQNMGSKAKLDYQNNYTLEKLCTQTINFYQTCKK